MEENEFNKLAKEHKNKVLMYFVVFLSFSSLSFSIKEWANNQHGWESEIVFGFFYIAMSVSGLLALMFGYLLYAWFKNYKYAKRDSKTYAVEQLRNHWSEVVGPIPWK